MSGSPSAAHTPSAKNFATVLVNRFLLGAAGSVGSTLVGGTISDIFVPAQRGLPMALFGFCAVFATGFGSVTMAFVETVPRLGWRWVQWIQFSTWRVLGRRESR